MGQVIKRRGDGIIQSGNNFIGCLLGSNNVGRIFSRCSYIGGAVGEEYECV